MEWLVSMNETDCCAKRKSKTPWVAALVVVLGIAIAGWVWQVRWRTYHLAEVRAGVLYRDGNRGMTEFATAIRKSGVRTIVNSEPLGFATNHNAALRDGQADFALMLNDDLVFLPHSVPPLLEFMADDRNRRVAAVSPRLLNTDMTLQPSTYSFPTLIHSLVVCSGLRAVLPPMRTSLSGAPS